MLACIGVVVLCTLTDLGGGGVAVHVGSTTVTFAADGSISVG